MADKQRAINLLPNKDGGFTNQFLGWALTIGRLLIILTETLALGTFFYRFSIDMKIVDLRDVIKHERLIVSNYQNKESDFRNLQARLALAETSTVKGTQTVKIISDIIDMGRGKITFKKASITDNGVKLEVQATNGNTLSLFVNNLKNYPDITSVSIDNIENKTSISTVSMSITALLSKR